MLNMAYKNICGARNLAVKYLQEGDFTHLLFLDSDMEYQKHTLARLLQCDKDVVAVYYCRKLPPFTPCAFRKKEDGFLYWFTPGEKLEPVDACGTGGMLIKREVFDRVPKPYFIYEQSAIEDWNTTTEDITFCLNAREAGVEIFVDGTLTANHVTDMMVVPGKDGAKIVPMGGEQHG
jgi:GT2 family glycosyltransferase